MMVVDAGRRPVETLARAAAEIGAAADLHEALGLLAAAAADASGADLAVIRLLDSAGDLAARAAAPRASSLAAEIAGTRVPCESLAAGAVSGATLRAAERVNAAGTLALAARGAGGRVIGSLELIRITDPFSADEIALAELAAAQLALTIRTLGPEGRADLGGGRWLEVVGEALAAGSDAARIGEQTVRAAVEATGAEGGTLWRTGGSGQVELLASSGAENALDEAAALVRESIGSWRPVAVEAHPDLPGNATRAATVTLGQPPFGALQLYFLEETMPPDHELPALAAFATRAALALRAGDHAKDLEEELARTRALLEVIGEAIARLSLAHTLETAVERISELLDVERVGVYLREDGRLLAAAGRGLSAGHEEVAAQLLDVSLGPLRARAAVHADVADDEPALAGPRAALAASGQRSVLGVPLHVRDDSIGLLVAYPGGRTLGDSDISLLTSLAAQLAVAVQNARLHERAKELGEALGDVLATERQASRQVTALYEISRSFAQSLSLDTTLDAVAETIVTVLDVDAAVIRLPDERGDQFTPRAVHVADSRLAGAVQTILERPQRRPSRAQQPLLLTAAAAARLGGAHALLIPFLEKGSTAALLPIAVGGELLAELTVLSLDPAEPIDVHTLATARTIAQQASLAIDNARLYQQQKQFAETMQQSLLPSDRPDVAGLEIGTVYESAAEVDVGGDVFDFMELPDGRLAVVLGDVTGHGIDATADMAMAKFVFRSLAREHPEPGDFLAHANDVVVGEIASGKFITMAYLVIDPRGTVECASAGHPQPRLVLSDGTVEPLRAGGLALGIDAPQTYEPVRAELPPGAAVVLYTDGVIEARRGSDLFGSERLDQLLADTAGKPAQAIADAAVSACRSYAGGGLGDDCAIVVIKKTA